MKIAILHADHNTEDEIINLLCTDGERKMELFFRGFLPYFYISLEDEKNSVLEILNSKKEVIRVENLNHKLKIYAKKSKFIPEIREEIKNYGRTFEYNIPFIKRFLIDKNLKPMTFYETKLQNKYIKEISGPFEEMHNYRFLAFDFETYKNRIVAATFFSDNFSKVLLAKAFEKNPKNSEVEVIENESEFLKRIIDILNSEKFEFVVGYNTDSFDLEILNNSCMKQGIESKIEFVRRGIRNAAKLKNSVHIDLFPFFSNILSRSMKIETFTLNNVAKAVLGEGKEEYTLEKLNSAWENKDPEFLEYAIWDSKLLFNLSKEILPLIIELSRITGVLPFEISRASYGQLVENLLIREAAMEKALIPNIPERTEILERELKSYEGGFVKEPKEGFYEKLAVFDYRSLYPSIILAHNISPETINCPCCKNKSEVHFCQKKQGFIPKVIENLVKQRFKLKDDLKKLEKGTESYRKINTRQNALKILLNAFYGYLAYSRARWYSKECAKAITAYGRRYIKKAMDEAENAGFEVIYGDTDSILIKYDSEKRAIEFMDKINSTLPKFMELELEGFYKTGIFTFTEEGRGAKKRYALLKENGELKIVGFEKVRRDWSNLAKEVQERVILEVLNKNLDGAVQFVRKVIEELKNKKVPMEKLAIHTQITKSLKKYDILAPHTEAAKKAIERGVQISPGDVIKYIITPGKGKISERAEILKFAQDYDSEYYIEHQIMPAALRILKVFNYRKEDLLGTTKQSGLKLFTK